MDRTSPADAGNEARTTPDDDFSDDGVSDPLEQTTEDLVATVLGKDDSEIQDTGEDVLFPEPTALPEVETETVLGTTTIPGTHLHSTGSSPYYTPGTFH